MKITYRIASLLFIFAVLGCTEEKNYITQQITPTDWQGPMVEWASPMDAEVRGTIGLDVSVYDSSSVLRVKLYVDGREDRTLTAPPYRFEVVTDSLSDGMHLCEARAWDQYENLGISPILRVNVANSVAQGPQLIWVPDNYAQIQAAINASQDDDTIRVRDGTYYETLNTFGKGIWIESEHGPIMCEINSLGSWTTLFLPGGQKLCTIRGLQLAGANYVIGLGEGARSRIVNNIVMSDTGAGLLIASRAGGEICNNLFTGSRTAVQISYHWGSFLNDIIQNAESYAFWNAAMAPNPLRYGYNMFWDNSQDYAGFEPGIGDTHANPLLDLVNGQLLPESPARDTGDPQIEDRDGSRSDIGPFGGPYAY